MKAIDNVITHIRLGEENRFHGSSETYGDLTKDKRAQCSSSERRSGYDVILQSAIGRAVRHLRNRHELSGRVLAKSAGISLGMLSRIENGTVSPSLDTLQALASAFGVPVTALLSGHIEQSRAIFIASSARQYQQNDIQKSSLRGMINAVPLNMCAYIVKFASHGEWKKRIENRSTFFIYCLNGEVICSYLSKRYVITTGDSLIFESSIDHLLISPKKCPASIIVTESNID
jgi:transcriptional regulator with XRE-family HTH domain